MKKRRVSDLAQNPVLFDPKEHWEKIYRERTPDQMSWFQSDPSKSLSLVAIAKTPLNGSIIDVGGGASVLVDRLLLAGFKDITVLDISNSALEYARGRLKTKAARVKWVFADVIGFNPSVTFDLWHDRAAFHFLTKETDRKKYIAILSRALKPGGHVILASFALDGPNTCSNLPVCRYDAGLITKELGIDFKLIKEDFETHITPWKKEQKFRYFLFERK